MRVFNYITVTLLTEVCMTCVWNLTYSPLFPTNYMVPLPTNKMVQGWTLRQMVFGVEDWFLSTSLFNPITPSNRNLPPSTAYRKHEREKKRAYEQRVREIEHSSFTPLVLSASGVWALKPRFFTSVLPAFWQGSGIYTTAGLCVGCVVV